MTESGGAKCGECPSERKNADFSKEIRPQTFPSLSRPFLFAKSDRFQRQISLVTLPVCAKLRHFRL
jgi:hypothetical protein